MFLSIVGCSDSEENVILKLATTTSTEDSGLLDELLVIFQQETGYGVDVIATGTGQALELGKRGDADVLLVHAEELEKEFIKDGYGTKRVAVMYNDFVIVGPVDDPAGLKEVDFMEEAMDKIPKKGQESKASFVSRGDGSGTHNKEILLWEKFEIEYEGQKWYNSLGQGMGDTLIFSNEIKGYTLSDRSTFITMEDRLENLQIIYENDDLLNNPYSLIPVNPDKFQSVKKEAAEELVEFFVRDDIQEKISEFGIESYGQPLFVPDAD